MKPYSSRFDFDFIWVSFGVIVEQRLIDLVKRAGLKLAWAELENLELGFDPGFCSADF